MEPLLLGLYPELYVRISNSILTRNVNFKTETHNVINMEGLFWSLTFLSSFLWSVKIQFTDLWTSCPQEGYEQFWVFKLNSQVWNAERSSSNRGKLQFPSCRSVQWSL
jgi:hypothetical protein